MLAAIGLVTILALLAVILLRKLSPLVALIVIPVVGAFCTGAGVMKVGGYMVDGIKNIAPVAAMFIFAIVFFGVLTDTGLFDPIISGILRAVGSHPTRIVIGTAVLAMLVHLEGSGAVTFLITIPPLLPVYDRLRMDRRVLACVVALGAGAMIMPWGGPALRVASTLNTTVGEFYHPLILPVLSGVAFVILVAWWLGRRETKRLALVPRDLSAAATAQAGPGVRDLTPEEKSLRRPKMFWVNAALTVAVVAGLVVVNKLAPALFFMAGATLALILNYPSVDQQRARVDAHAKAALMMASILLAAGSFTGIMTGTGMIKEMAKAAVSLVPHGLGSQIPIIVAVLSMPMSLLFDPDSFYFGFLPVVTATARALGVGPFAVAQAAIIGQMTTGFPVSPLTPATFLLVGMTQVELGTHQRFTIPFAFATTLVMAIVSIAIGLYPL